MKLPSLEKMTVFLFALFIGVLLYFMLYPFNPATLKSFKTEKTLYKRGEEAIIELKFNKHMNVTPKTKWSIVDGVVYELNTPGQARPTGQQTTYTSKTIPLSIMPGKYHFRVELEYNVHPLHQIIYYVWNSNDFTVER